MLVAKTRDSQQQYPIQTSPASGQVVLQPYFFKIFPINLPYKNLPYFFF